MKDFINILVILILVGLAVGLSYLMLQPETPFLMGSLYIPLIVFFVYWGEKLTHDY